MDLQLYHRPDCPFCWKLRIGMAELGLKAQEIRTRLGEKHPDVIRLSPKGTVPVLVDLVSDVVIWESSVALEYINDRTGGALLSADPVMRARARLIASYSDSVMGTALRDIIFEKRSKPEAEWDTARIAEGVERWRTMCDRLEDWLGPDSYFAGDFSIADCALLARFGLAEAYGAPVTAAHPNLQRWFTTNRNRASYRSTIPQNFPGVD